MFVKGLVGTRFTLGCLDVGWWSGAVVFTLGFMVLCEGLGLIFTLGFGVVLGVISGSVWGWSTVVLGGNRIRSTCLWVFWDAWLKIVDSWRNASWCWEVSRWSGELGLGFLRASISSFAACVALSAEESLGIVVYAGKNSTVLDMRVAPVSGT